jgi:hypothetical protein
MKQIIEVTGLLICFTLKHNHFLKIDDETKLKLVKYQKLHPELADPSEFEIYGTVAGDIGYQNIKLTSFPIDLATQWGNFSKISDLNEFFDRISETIKTQISLMTDANIEKLQQDIIKLEAKRVKTIDKVNAAKTMHDLINLY